MTAKSRPAPGTRPVGHIGSTAFRDMLVRTATSQANLGAMSAEEHAVFEKTGLYRQLVDAVHAHHAAIKAFHAGGRTGSDAAINQASAQVTKLEAQARWQHSASYRNGFATGDGRTPPYPYVGAQPERLLPAAR
jgi:hypothetical protein